MFTKSFIGGVNTSFCQCAQSAVGCYGDVHCDCSDPKGARCVPNQSMNEVNKIMEMRKNNSNNRKLNKNKNESKKNRKKIKNKHHKFHKIYMNANLFSSIVNGEKEYIIRPDRHKIRNVLVGDILIIHDDNNELRVKIIEKTQHDDLLSALRIATLKRTLPEIRRFEKAINFYKNMNKFNYKNKQKYISFRIEKI